MSLGLKAKGWTGEQVNAETQNPLKDVLKALKRDTRRATCSLGDGQRQKRDELEDEAGK